MSQNGSSDSSSYADENWAAWFCNLSGNQYFCEVEKSYMEDSFNLFGLKQHLPKDYSKALDSILDRLNPNEPETEDLSRSAVLLYGLIHARYIITSHGLEAMHRKYINKDFGECPRMLCRGQPVVPMGFTDDPKHGMVKLFCPKCRDVYNCHINQRRKFNCVLSIHPPARAIPYKSLFTNLCFSSSISLSLSL
jgi:casein kinase II subunit beta